MIYFLYGSDTYRSREKLREIINEYKKAHTSGLSFSRLDLEKDDFKEFEKRLSTVSLFPEKKLIVAERASANKEFQKQFEDFLKKSSLEKDKDIIVIFFEDMTPKQNDPWQKLLGKISKVQEFKELKGGERKRWIVNYLKGKNKIMDSGVLEKFLLLAEPLDTWGLKNELDKLIHYSGKGQITEKDIEIHMKPDFKMTIFEVLDALGAKNRKRALLLIERMIEKGESEAYILSMIAYGLRNLIQVKSLDEERVPYYLFQKKLSMHPFVMRKTYQQSKHFTLEELKKTYQRLAEIDLSIKVGKVEPRIALELLVTSF